MAGAVTRKLRQGLYEAMALGARYPRLAVPVARWRGYGAPLSADTEIVIEGFPCSANTFVVEAFRLAQGRPVGVAHHLHAPGHVIAALRRGVPALVLIREPDGAASDFARAKPALTLAQVLRAYVRFYEPLLEYRHRLVVGPFEEVTTDLGAVIRRVNVRFGTAFEEFRHTEENMAQAREAADDYWETRREGGRPLLGRIAPGPVVSPDHGAVDRGRHGVGPLEAIRRRAHRSYLAMTRGGR